MEEDGKPGIGNNLVPQFYQMEGGVSMQAHLQELWCQYVRTFMDSGGTSEFTWGDGEPVVRRASICGMGM